MSDPILHHYWESPYSEKIRLILGYKQLPWRSVVIPIVMPKPDLLALTGGYRKTPVLQIGADVYCDTDCIVRVLERLRPEPTVHPEGSRGLAEVFTPWQQHLFMTSIYMFFMAPPSEGGISFPEGFLDDRQTMVEGGIDAGRILRELPALRDQLRAMLQSLEEQLAERPFLLGAQPALADFSFCHPLLFLKQVPATRPLLAPYPGIEGWLERLEAIGHGSFTELDSGEAVEIARAAEPATAEAVDPGDPNGRKPGDRLTVVHRDFGRDPVSGELVASDAHEIALRREDPRAGTVVVHFPRQNYLVLPA